MSFLTKSKSSLADSPSRLGSRFEGKDRSIMQNSATKPREDIMGNLQVFREDLRKQISDKITKNFKFLDVSSPKAPSNLTTLLSNKHAEASSPIKSTLFNREYNTPLSMSASQKKFDLTKDFSRRGERGSPSKQSTANKNSDLLDYISKNKRNQRLSASVAGSALLSTTAPTKSPSRAAGSPHKDSRSALDIKPLDYFKKESEKKRSYLEPRASANVTKQSDFRDDIKHILAAGRSPKQRREFNSSPQLDGERQSGLSHQLALMRSNRTALISPSAASGIDYNSALKHHSNGNLRASGLSIKDYYGSGNVNTSNLGNQGSVRQQPSVRDQGIYGSHREESEGSSRKKGQLELKSMNILTPHSMTGITNESFSLLKADTEVREGKRERLVSDALPLSKLYEVQDLFYNVTDKGFDQLTPEYVEELIKLSSVIMHRVKNSSYYNRT